MKKRVRFKEDMKYLKELNKNLTDIFKLRKSKEAITQLTRELSKLSKPNQKLLSNQEKMDTINNIKRKTSSTELLNPSQINIKLDHLSELFSLQKDLELLDDSPTMKEFKKKVDEDTQKKTFLFTKTPLDTIEGKALTSYFKTFAQKLEKSKISKTKNHTISKLKQVITMFTDPKSSLDKENKQRKNLKRSTKSKIEYLNECMILLHDLTSNSLPYEIDTCIFGITNQLNDESFSKYRKINFIQNKGSHSLKKASPYIEQCRIKYPSKTSEKVSLHDPIIKDYRSLANFDTPELKTLQQEVKGMIDDTSKLSSNKVKKQLQSSTKKAPNIKPSHISDNKKQINSP